jgi:hypothetical protein
VIGDPRFKPPVTVRQLTFSIRPTLVQVSPAVMIPVDWTLFPGKVRNFEAMLFAGARAAKAGVSYQPEPVLVELLGDD